MTVHDPNDRVEPTRVVGDSIETALRACVEQPKRARLVARTSMRNGVARVHGIEGMCPRGHVGGTAEKCERCELIARLCHG